MNSDPNNPLSWIFPIVIIIILVFFSAFFSLAETTYTCMNQFKIKVLADEGKKSAKRALKLHKKFDNTLISVLIGNNIVAILVSTLSTLFFVWFFALINVQESIASVIATILMTIIVYLFGDTIPKFIAKQNPDAFALRLSGITYFFVIIFKPLALIFGGLTLLTKKIFKADNIPTMTEEEFSDLIEEAEENGTLEENESDIIQASLDFDDTLVKEVLTPKEKMFTIDITNLTNKKLNEIIADHNYARIPIYEGDPDNIIGILHVRTYLRRYFKNKKTSIRRCLQEPYIVSTRVKLETIFDGFNENHTHIAIVKNGDNLVGMVTMDDVLEELVGDIDEVTPDLKGEENGN